MSEERCLHCDINELVREHMEGNDAINLPDLIAKMGESLVDLILLGPEDQWSLRGARHVLVRGTMEGIALLKIEFDSAKAKPKESIPNLNSCPHEPANG